VDEGRGLLTRGLASDSAERLRDALSLWRGPALVEFAYMNLAQPAIARLEEIRLAALELRIEADLTRGHHDELIVFFGPIVSRPRFGWTRCRGGGSSIAHAFAARCHDG
jgi:hypothetical protein